jgi:hypothetical protein
MCMRRAAIARAFPKWIRWRPLGRRRAGLPAQRIIFSHPHPPIPSAPRGRSGWSGGRAGPQGAAPSPSGALG